MQGLGEVFAEQPTLARLVASVLADLQTEQAAERPVGTVSPLTGPLVDGCRAAMLYLEWQPVFEYLADQAAREPIAIDPVGTLRFAEGRFLMDFDARPECHPSLLAAGSPERARVDALVEGYRAVPRVPDAEDAVDGEVKGAAVYVRRFDPGRFPDQSAFLAHEGLADRAVPEHDRMAWFDGLQSAGRAEPWAVAFRSRVESAPMLAGYRFLHGVFRSERRAGQVRPGTVEMFAAYDGGFVSARYAFESDPRDRRILKRLRKRGRRGE
ncbi:MAG: hypothetical protein R3F61_23770 [Myxococcota bacterium]